MASGSAGRERQPPPQAAESVRSDSTMLSRPLLAGVAIALIAAGTAKSDVLVNAIEPVPVKCGSAVKLGVWYQSFTGGPSWANIEIENANAKVIWKRHANATATWHYWRYYPHCGASYTAVYKTANGTELFPFIVR